MKTSIPTIFNGPDWNIRVIVPFFHGTYEKESKTVSNAFVYDANEGLNADIDFSFEPSGAISPQVIQGWDSTSIRWDDCVPGKEAGILFVREACLLEGHDRFVACLGASGELDLVVSLKIDGVWQKPEQRTSEKRRFEWVIPVNGKRLEEVKISFRPTSSGPRLVSLAWFGLLKNGYKLHHFRKGDIFDTEWTGLIRKTDEWDEVCFARNLLFDASQLDALREKRERPFWKEHYQMLKRSAGEAMQKAPEALIGWTIPWSDGRYTLSPEICKDTWFFEPLTLGIVGLVEGDTAMQRMAIRYLMCFLHTDHWCQSENLMNGSAWDQRCFLEELSSTTVALLADWFDFALTDHAKHLVCRSLWKKGLSIIDGDLMKYGYMWVMNQGAWFCRARILGGLVLEKHWPRMGGYVERAYQDMMEILDLYILEDGGTDEGVGYFSLTMSICLEGIIAYARANGKSVTECLPKGMENCEAFVSTLSGMHPGTTLMDGDNSFNRFVGNTIPLLANIYPGSVYEKILGGLLGHPKPDTYFSQYMPNMELSFVLGPGEVLEPCTIVPTFHVLEHSGHLTSLRRHQGLSVRLHLAGAKAYASHTHYDKGSFTLEIGNEPVLIDRGVVRYDDPNVNLMKNTELHNVLTPVAEDGSFKRQSPVTAATLPEGSGDDVCLDCTVDLKNVWRNVMHACCRSIHSDNPLEFEVCDKGELIQAQRLGFHLHSLYPFDINGKKAIIRGFGFLLEIIFDYAEEIRVYEDLFDYKHRPVNHLVAIAPESKSFDLITRFKINAS